MLSVCALYLVLEVCLRISVCAVGLPEPDQVLGEIALARPAHAKDYWISTGRCSGRKAGAAAVEVCVPLYASDTTNTGIIGNAVGSFMVALLGKVYNKDGNIVGFASSAQYFFTSVDCSGTATVATAGYWNGRQLHTCGSSTLDADFFVQLLAVPKGTAPDYPDAGTALMGFANGKCGGAPAFWYWDSADKCFNVKNPSTTQMAMYNGHCADNLQFFIYSYAEDNCKGKMSEILETNYFISGSGSCTVNDWSSPSVFISDESYYEAIGYSQCVTGPNSKPCPAGKDKSAPMKKSLREATA